MGVKWNHGTLFCFVFLKESKKANGLMFDGDGDEHLTVGKLM